ncbi:MAG: metallophosphoesterase [Wujia sp.]
MRFAHIADVHLGKKHETPELYDGFLNFVDYLEINPVDMIFITGDLFDHVPSAEDLTFVDTELARLDHTDILYVTGECDCLERDCALWTYEFVSRTYLLNCEEIHNHVKEEARPKRNSYAEGIVDSLYFEKYNLDIYGICQYSRFNERNDFDGVYAHDLRRVSIFLGHGGSSKVNPFDLEDFDGRNFAYVGLGHKHRHQEYEKAHVYYPGSLEPISEEETGEHGFIRGYTDGHITSVKFIPIAVRKYEEKQEQRQTIDYELLYELNAGNALGIAMKRMEASQIKEKEQAKETYVSLMLKALNQPDCVTAVRAYPEDAVQQAYGEVREQLIEQTKKIREGMAVCEREQQELQAVLEQCPDQTGTTNILHEDINKLKFDLEKLKFEDSQVDKKYSRRRLSFILWIDTPLAITLAILLTFGPFDVFFLRAWNAWFRLITQLFVFEILLTILGFVVYNGTKKLRKRMFGTEVPVETHARLQSAMKEFERRIHDLELVESSRFLDQKKYDENTKKLQEINDRYQQLLEMSEINLLILGEKHGTTETVQ